MIDHFCSPNIAMVVEVLITISLIGFASLGFLIANLHEFLAKNSPVVAEVLVVEGWLPDYAIKEAMTEFQSGSYQTLITIGAPLPRGFYLSEDKTFAELAGATLVALGFDPQKLLVVSTTYTPECRTQNAASSLKKYMEELDNPIQSINVFSFGPHARRTWLVFRKVFGFSVTVGIISAKPLAYQPKRWWKSSEGVRTVIGELIAYLYKRFWH